MTREREVYEATGELQDPRHATVEVHGAGGLYVKELVSGDEGRTEPSLAGLLGVGAEVTALDVLAVEGEDEPFERSEFFRDPPEDDVEGGGTGDGDDGDDDDGDGTEGPRGDDATADTAADESGSNRGTTADS
jgi:hypothetical protein